MGFADKLSAGRVPLFHLTCQKTEVGEPEKWVRPAGWQKVAARSNGSRLRKFRPGDGLAALTGHRFIVIDVDTRNGGDDDRARRILKENRATVYCRVRTPGGGYHHYIANHPHISTAHNTTIFGPGVDILALGSNVFIPPTIRWKYGGGRYEVEYDRLDRLFRSGKPADVGMLHVALNMTLRLAGGVNAPEARRSRMLDASPEPVRAGGWSEWDGRPLDSEQEAAVERSVRAKVEAVCGLPEGTRNSGLFKAAVSLFELVGVDHGRVRRELIEACRGNGYVDDDGLGAVEQTLDSAEQTVALKPLRMPPRTRESGITRQIAEKTAPLRGEGDAVAPAVVDAPAPSEGSLQAKDDPAGVALEHFWTSRPELALVRHHARQRMVSSMAVLGCVLAYAVTMVDPVHALPAIVGGRQSLNMYVAIVGRSGSGKDAAKSAARELVAGADEVHETSPGSGEGITHVFRKASKEHPEGEEIRRSAMLFASEVDALTTLGGRSGSTLMAVTRSAWNGAALGHAYVDQSKAITVPANQYRLTLVVGVQPERAAPLLDEADGGTPQRFLWMPATDPDAIDPGDDLTPLVKLQTYRSQQPRVGDLFVPPTVRAQLRADRLAKVRGHDSDDDRFAGHLGLSRLKVAQALAFLAGRRDMIEQDWDLAGTVIDVSEATRRGVERALSAKAEKAATIRGRMDAAAQDAADRFLEHAKGSREAEQVRRVAQRITSALSTMDGSITRKALRQKFNSADRKAVTAALDHLLASGVVHQDQTGLRLAAR